MEKHIRVTCECEGTGYIGVADIGGDGIDYVECSKHHPDFADIPSVNDLIDYLGDTTGLKLK